MARMDADGGQYIRADPSRSVFYSREFRVIARAGRKVSHLLDGRSHRYTCSHFSWSEGILPSETRRGRDARAPRVSPAIDALINTAAMGRPRSHRTPALPRDARASSEGILPSETRRGRGRPRTQGTLTLSEGIFPSETRRGRGRPRTQGVTPGVNGYSVSTSAGATTIISSKSRKSSPLNVNRCVTSWASIAATSRAS